MKLRGKAIVLFLIVMGSSGCAGADLAAGPLLMTLHFIGGRSVERSLPADLVTAWTATLDALTRMEIRVRDTDRSGESWVLEGVGETIGVHVTLARITPRMTRISLRVENGGLLADKETAVELLNQVASSLAGPTAGARSAPATQAETPVALGKVSTLSSDGAAPLPADAPRRDDASRLGAPLSP